jgi:pimeloyl-ACP methyl ester carboxylesterase
MVMTQTVLSKCCLAMATLVVFTAQRASDGPRVNTVRVRNTELSYIDVGRGEPVVLIHGALHDYRSWSPTWPELSKHYRVIAYSQRHNFPNPPLANGSQPSAVDGATDLVAFVEALGMAPVHLVGHSRGANIALIVARNRPGLVRSLVLGEGGFPAITALSPEARLLPTDTGQALEAYRRGDVEGAARLVAENVIGTKDAYDQAPLDQRRLLLDNIPREFGPQLASSRASVPPQFGCDDARQIRVPTLMIGGERTAARFRVSTEELRKCMPASDYTLLPQATHALHLENPSAFNAIVLQFLTRQSKRSG